MPLVTLGVMLLKYSGGGDPPPAPPFFFGGGRGCTGTGSAGATIPCRSPTMEPWDLRISCALAKPVRGGSGEAGASPAPSPISSCEGGRASKASSPPPGVASPPFSSSSLSSWGAPALTTLTSITSGGTSWEGVAWGGGEEGRSTRESATDAALLRRLLAAAVSSWSPWRLSDGEAARWGAAPSSAGTGASLGSAMPYPEVLPTGIPPGPWVCVGENSEHGAPPML
mmetsp:Transcript_47813/g.153253  ORF Transcript_47813/g.153253 Transcript_47813/m.153253 type:complete len:226 (-) Transcript_47813:137-814(-)